MLIQSSCQQKLSYFQQETTNKSKLNRLGAIFIGTGKKSDFTKNTPRTYVRILRRLQLRAIQYGHLLVSQAELAQDAGCSEDHAGVVLRSMEELGYIRIKHNGLKFKNTYTLSEWLCSLDGRKHIDKLWRYHGKRFSLGKIKYPRNNYKFQSQYNGHINSPPNRYYSSSYSSSYSNKANTIRPPKSGVKLAGFEKPRIGEGENSINGKMIRDSVWLTRLFGERISLTQGNGFILSEWGKIQVACYDPIVFGKAKQRFAMSGNIREKFRFFVYICEKISKEMGLKPDYKIKYMLSENSGYDWQSNPFYVSPRVVPVEVAVVVRKPVPVYDVDELAKTMDPEMYKIMLEFKSRSESKNPKSFGEDLGQSDVN